MSSSDTESSVPSNRLLIGRMLGLVWAYKWSCLGVICKQLGLLSLGMFGLGLTGLGVDVVRFHMAGEGAGTKPPQWPFGLQPPDDWTPFTALMAIAVAILLFAAVRSLLNMYYTISVNQLLQGKIVVELRARVYRKMQQLSFRFFDANASGGLINRVTGDVQAVRSFVDGVAVHSLILVLSLCVYLAYMMRIHVGLTLACLATTPLMWVITARFSRRVRPAYVKNRELFDDQIRVLSENVQGAHVVKGFALQACESEKFGKSADAVRAQKRWIFDQISVFQPLVGLLSQANLVVLLAYGGLLAVAYEEAPDAATAVKVGVSVGQLIVFAGLLQQFSGQIANIAGIADSMQQSLTGAQRVFEVLDTPVEIASKPDALRVERMKGAVEFDNVSFEFRPDVSALHSVSFRVASGQCVAVLGATGAGKSTLLSLIPRFYDVNGGAVRVDGVDVRDLDLNDLRRQIGIVFQESFLFSNSIHANIAFGHPEATRAQVEQAARVAAAHDFIMALPQGYDTILREGGSNLSGGQRQRLAIARAVLHDPAILLLDDPTAAIDSQTESEIMTAMNSAMAGRTTFLVANRLSTLRRADWVVVLEQGRVAQMGTHEELMASAGVYRRAASLQIPDAMSLRLLNGDGGDAT